LNSSWSFAITIVSQYLRKSRLFSLFPLVSVLEGLEGEYTYGKDGKPDKNCKTSDVMDALQYICMDIGARIVNTYYFSWFVDFCFYVNSV
jgi:hypothetical protein